MSLNNLWACGLSALGRRERALEATEEAARHYRTLAQAWPGAFLPVKAVRQIGVTDSGLRP